ncbi:MAG: glutamate-1-semialdehyde 2,1-aminomutase [Deltaproteobacteria bacterium]|nr:MAG: glutamate-1-semialdehyde 2,1-aminomutase [Deltaproteobacteria bacterium]
MVQVSSDKLYRQAEEVIPGGVNSPVRSCRAVGTNPLFITKGHGSKIYDVDGNAYIDYVGSWGPLILGHAHPEVVAAIKAAADNGTSFGIPTTMEVELAQMISQIVPSMEMVRMVNSGTEATMSAIRLARGYTGRSKIIKFDGCYHGHADSLLVKAGSGAATLGIPGSAGVPADFAKHTLSLRFNDLKQVATVMQSQGQDVAAIIIEPVAGNMGVVVPRQDFLEGLRFWCDETGALLIFDEVMTGFRVALGGAQFLYGVRPDLTCLGKVIGGGLPVGAYGGRRDVMSKVAPLGEVYQAGTLSGNPLAVTAGMTTLKLLTKPGVYDELEERSAYLFDEMSRLAAKHELPSSMNRVGSMGCLFFTNQPVTDFDSAQTSDTQRFARMFCAMLARGIYLAPSQFEAAFVSLAHDQQDIDKTLAAADEAFKEI